MKMCIKEYLSSGKIARREIIKAYLFYYQTKTLKK
jgi:hypothetical protein